MCTWACVNGDASDVRKDEYKSPFLVFARFRGQLAWIGNHTRPDLTFEAAFMSQQNDQENPQLCAELQKTARKHLEETKSSKLVYPKLDFETLQLGVYSDASHKLDADSAQCSYVILLGDNQKKVNIIHWGSAKPRRITRSSLAAETAACTTASDIATVIKLELENLLNVAIDLIEYTDSDSLFKLITSTKMTTEQRLIFEVNAIREKFAAYELSNVALIQSKHQVADPLTKNMRSEILATAMNGHLEHPIQQWLTSFDEDGNGGPSTS